MERWKIAESYSDPLLVYERAVAAGMSLVTLTDHNRIDGALLLRERYGDRVITGVEATACFPEDRCKVHVLVYGITENEFADIDSLRKDIYELRAYLREKDLAHSVAHGTYSVQAGKLTVAHLEKLIVLFNTFEVINGGRNRSDNIAWRYILERLTPDCLDDLCKKHSLEPFDSEPWKKGFTAGSDDHGGIFIGRTYTEADGPGPEDVLDALRGKRTSAGGRHSDYQTLAFSVYKVVHDSYRSTPDRKVPTLFGQLAEMLYEGKKVGIAGRIRIRGLKRHASKGENGMYAPLSELMQDLREGRPETLETTIRRVYTRMAHFSDGFLRLLFDSLGSNMGRLDFLSMVKNIQASLPGLFLSLPFFLTLRHLNENRALVGRLMSALRIERAAEGYRVLWFTDTLNDLNGVSTTLHEVGRLALERGLDVKIVTSLETSGLPQSLPNVLNLPFVHEFNLPYYESYRLKIPSLLMSLKEMYLFDPDRIHISTPGPLGLLGLLTAKLMNVKSVGFYHTDFSLQAREIVEDESVAHLLESYTRWFYTAMDEIRVPTAGYITILQARGFDPRKMKHFTRGIDAGLFKPQFSSGRTFLGRRFGMDGRITLLYVGRISCDKGLDFLFDAFRQVAAERADVHLLVVGDGPYLGELQAKADPGRVTFAGRMAHQELPAVYGGSHLFVFPSTTDTFGKVVLEAQACGLPAIVSDVGGPQELILQGKTGFAAKAGDLSDWKNRIDQILNLISLSPGSYGKMREDARRWAVENFDWDNALGSIFEEAPSREIPVEEKIA
ncbi:MAG: glycosyltransferase [Syntrophorhabdales bacterium]|jgi:glycosyltransferase involved in cell wall biosynthesis